MWRFGSVDFDGPFGWIECRPRAKLREVIQKLGKFESMTWQQIEGARCHFIGIESLSKQAQDRLRELGQDDVDELFSLRLSGAERVFGIRDRWIFRILWWDPDHRVCPSVLSNT